MRPAMVGLVCCISMFCANLDVLAVDLMVVAAYEDENCTKSLNRDVPFILANTCVQMSSESSVRFNCTSQMYNVYTENNACEGRGFGDSPMDTCSAQGNYKCKEFPDNKVVIVKHGVSCNGKNVRFLHYEESVVLNTCFEYPRENNQISFRITLSGDVLTYTRFTDSAKCEGQSVSDNFFVGECKLFTGAGSGRRLQGSEAMQISAAVPGVILDGSSSRTKPSLFSVLVLAGVMVATLNA